MWLKCHVHCKPIQSNLQIKVLMDRFNKTTSESEGGEEFREDIRQLDLDMQQVIDAGIVGIHEVRLNRVWRIKKETKVKR